MQKKKFSIRKIAALLVACSLLAVVAAQIFYARMTEGDRATDTMYARLGQLGDFYGGIINPIVGIITIILLLFTIYMQHDEMRAAKEDALRSKQHDDELLAIAKSEAAAAESARQLASTQALEAVVRERNSLARQSFEQSFYALLPIYLGHIEDFEHKHDNVTHRGRHAIARHHLQSMRRDTLNTTIQGMLTIEEYQHYLNLRPFDPVKVDAVSALILDHWLDAMVQHNEQYHLIFRVLLHMLHWIDIQDEEVVPFAAKKNLVALINSHMCESEFWSLFYHVVGGYGREFVSYVEKYSLFEPHWRSLQFPSFLNYAGRHLLRHTDAGGLNVQAAFGAHRIDTNA